MSNGGITVIVKRLNNACDDQFLRDALFNLLPEDICKDVDTILVRNSLGFKSAFIKLFDSSFGSEVVRLLNNNVRIEGVKIWATLDDARRFKSFSSSSNSNSRPPIPTREESSPTYPDSSLTRSDEEPELVQLHATPFPLVFADSRIRTFLGEQLNHLFFSNSSVIVQSSPEGYKMAFISLLNRSNKSASTILSQISNTIKVDGSRVKFSFQKNPRPPSNAELDHLCSRYDASRVTSSSTSTIESKLEPDNGQRLALHCNFLPPGNTGFENFNIVRPLLEEHFKDSGVIKVVRMSDTRVSAFIDVRNKSGEHYTVIMERLSAIKPIGGTRNLSVGFRHDPRPIELFDQVSYQKHEAKESTRNSERSPLRSSKRSNSRNRSVSPKNRKRSRESNSVRSGSPAPTSSRMDRRESWLDELQSELGKSNSPDLMDVIKSRTQKKKAVSSSPDPFDIVASNSKSDTSNNQFQGLSNLIVSSQDSDSINLLSEPINSIPDSISFNRTVSTEFSFGQLTLQEAKDALSSISPFWNQQQKKQVEYEKFLLGQSGSERDYYFRLLGNVEGFSERNRMFSEIANSL